MRSFLARTLAFFLSLVLHVLLWREARRTRRLAPFPPPPPPDAYFLCKASLGTSPGCHLCGAKRRETGG